MKKFFKNLLGITALEEEMESLKVRINNMKKDISIVEKRTRGNQSQISRLEHRTRKS